MEYSNDTANTQYDLNNIQKVLINQLTKSRQQSPESFSKSIHVLSAINDIDDCQLEQQLQQEREDHLGERIILIPCYLKNAYWVGILMEFEAAGQIVRAEYINPVNGPNLVPDRLQKQIAKIYPSAVLQQKDLLKHNERRFSSVLTVNNLLTAVENNQYPDNINREVNQTSSIISNKSKPIRYSTESESINWQENKKSISTSTTHIPKEGNECILKTAPSASSPAVQSNIHELEEKLKSGLNKINLQSLDELSGEIQDTEERIQKFQRQGRQDKAQEEMEILRELQELRDLSDKITELTFNASVSSVGHESELRELREKLNSGLAKINLQSLDELSGEIQDTEERIQRFQRQGRQIKAQEEIEILRELQELKDVSDKISELTFNASVSSVGHESELRELREKLNSGLAKINLQSLDELSGEIQDTEERIQRFQRQGRQIKAQEEMEILRELQELKELSDRISELTFNAPVSSVGHESELRELREKLNSGLAKINLQNVDQLPEEIRDTEERIQKLQRQGRQEKAQEETEFLRELQNLKELSDRISELTFNAPVSSVGHESELRELREKLNSGLAKINLQNVDQLPEEIKETEERIQKLQRQGRQDKAQEEMEFLRELQELKELSDRISELTSTVTGFPDNTFDSDLAKHNFQNVTEPFSTPAHDIDVSFMQQPQSQPSPSTDIITSDDRKKKLLHIKELREEPDTMPSCAARTTIELLMYFEQRLLGENIPLENEDSLISSLQKLQDQVKKEELLSENTKAILRDLEMYITSDNYSVIVSNLNKLLKNIRSLNVTEIQRLVSKAKEAAELIRNKDIILLVGTTGAGKSTTIQFLAGATMKNIQVEISSGKYLEHVTAVGPIKNPELIHVNSSALQKSETRYIAPVTVQLKDVLDAHASGVITLCDAPGFGDTAGPEVDIANSIGVIEALKGTKSVKLLALSSYKSLGDRGQGIQKLAHILISMVHGIEDKLDAIFYAFTKYPETTNINALLVNIKISKVDTDVSLQSNTAFVTVLEDMIDKTEGGAFKIEPTRDEPKKLINKLKKIRGIKNPEEVFQFSMSEETRASIVDHVQRDKFSIICAMKHKDNGLVLYYFNDLKILKDLIKESFIRDAYEESIRFVSESISKYCTEIMEKFNRALASQDGLQEKDILDYRTSIKYLEETQTLKEHLGSYLLSPAALMQNIITELNEISRNLNEEDLHSPLMTIYLDNLSMLKSSFVELEENYNNICKKFEKRFDELVQSARELIPKNDFKQITEILLNIFQSARLLKKHLRGQVQGSYSDIINYLLRYLNSFSEKVEPLLARVRLNNEEVEIIKNYMEILRSAKENAALQERVSKYLEMLKAKAEVSDEHKINQTSGEKIKDLNEIYDEFIIKIIKYFDEINLRIKELFHRNGDHALEHIKTLVNDMDALRTIPELESKTAATYYKTVENIRGYMQELQGDAEKLLVAIDQKSGITNYRHLARTLFRLKNAEWINQVSPGTYDNLMQRITEELTQYACQLEDSLMKIDFSLKCPENVSVAKEIVEKIESMRDLERSVPELEKYRNNIVQRFLQCTQGAFNRIQKTFNLQDNDIYNLKQKLKELEEIKREYDSLHPARIYLQKQRYSDINMLNSEIEELKAKQKAELAVNEALQHDKESELDKLNSIIRKYMTLSSPTDQDLSGKVTGMITSRSQNNIAQAEAYLLSEGYSRIELIYEQIPKVQKVYHNKLQRTQDQNTEISISLHRLKVVKQQHDLLLANRHSSFEEVSFLQEKHFNSYELLEEAIQEKTKAINERGKNKQSHHFSDRLDALTANNALMYINQCEKLGHDRVKENAIDANENLRKYIREYGIFLNQEINRQFNYTRSVTDEGDPFLYSQDLEMRLLELSSFSRFQHVFECINGAEAIEKRHQEFLDFHRTLSSRMEQYKESGKIKELKDQLIIAQALTCVDRFCANVFVGNGFAALYRQYQGEINKECRIAYKTVLDYVLKGDYANAAIALSDIQENPLNPRDKAQIQHDLQCSLNKLMKDTKSITNWLDGKIEREDNRSQITEIKENIDKIRIAFNKHIIMELLDSNTQTNLRTFDNEINDVLSRILLKGLNSIEAFMDADSFSEAEQGMENLSRVQRELAGYCTSSNVTKKSEELRESLDKIVTTVLERNDFADVNKYSISPPKDLLAKLKTVASHGSARFTQAYTSMVGKIRQTFSLAIEEVRKAPLNERSIRIRSLNYALYFLPDDLQTEFKLQIDELSKLIADEETAYRQDLETSFTNVDEDENAITKLGLLADQYSTQNMHGLLKKLREECLKKLHMYRTNVQRSLDEQNIQSAIDTFKKILKYEESVGAYISEVKGICDNVRALTIRGFLSCCNTLGNISSIEQTQFVEKAFTDMLIYLDFSNTSDKRVKEFYSDDILQNATEAFQRMYTYLNENSEKFRVALKDMNILELQKVMLISKKWQKFLEKISQCQLNHNLIQNFLKEMKHVISYGDMISELEQIINHLESQINVEFISDETTRFEVKRDQLFSNLMNAINTLRIINLKFRDVLSSPIVLDTFEREIKVKVERIKNQLFTKASRDELSTKDADDFRMYYYHLVSFEKYVRLSGVDIRQVLGESEEKILAKVDSLNKQIINFVLDAVAVSTALIKIKFFAENLSMFEKNINDKIDDALKIYKDSQGSAGITRLSMELEKTEVGARLISEHSSLSGEDWRKRREKMQKQDDLEYVLQKLIGEDIAKSILSSRYKTFRAKYDELLSTFLKTLNQNDSKEPDLEVLVSQTKLLVGTVTQTPNSVTWARSFKEDIPELLAHISAIWTLKNTQHYNAMRGIKEAQSYLLMPHVGQVIAILRLLGIGYEESAKIPILNVSYKKISDDLVNNLVELGTGEGKSVVMAITACVFALTGVDVNCSCYSEVLSTRDKNDFASVFRVLGIEDRIEYGTFNKLCEQLLNEQCNVREKVRDMIVTNKSTLAAADTSGHKRPKVLLIDEVDVFLSDKYYGGMYIPSVYLKDPSIKALLDSIWQNKTLRSLNSVKALPAYQTCATQYSNWISLFDEAIKDMLAALQSYQSSTYIVQNDKIVYVEGESIVDNVVRGYDTIWAYYHENGKGSISQNSLDENVGILINCGTFSYAEMPHDFAYIGGVTGTLKTLAKVEKKILEKVYSINKTTFMPSVFGSSNRTYNPMNDVRVVMESEYFMEIRGEISVICNASRAILIFFESEEKLMAFYNSSELSSIKQDVQIIMEKVSVKERELYIKRAAIVGKVTLLTRTFGRGTDFICRNQQLIANGGVHVVQTFFSEELSEEYQIMGRGARQGDKGSYRMILLDKDLEWVLGSSWREELPRIIGTTLYEALDKARSARYESKCGAKELGIEQCKAEHKSSKEFMTALTTGNIGMIKEFLKKQNQGANLITASSRTVLLMDATGSMSSLLSAAKETVCTMFERASTVLLEKGLPNDAFQMQFVVYRDYDCRKDGVLQSSAWETKPTNLRNFMTKIGAMGGGDYEEAIEIGLWHAVQQNEQPDGISQVILIGDAPAKDKPAINRDRQAYGGKTYWSKTKYKTPTHYTEELQKLKVKKIPVHAFYLANGARENFQQIASETSGRCEQLNIHSAQGAESLTNFVTQEVLRKTAGDQGDAVVELYRKKYMKTFTS